MLKLILIIAACLIGAANIHAQIDEQSPLFIELHKQDSLFFERGFNQCDFDYIDAHVSEDLKFYHDQAGFQDKAGLMKSTRENICGNMDQKPIRKLESGTLEVFPLYNNGKLYAAIQRGVHNFYIREQGKPDVWTSTAKFTTVWVKEDNTWKMSEVLSFDHQSPEEQVTQVNDIKALLKEVKVPALGIGVIESGQLTKVEVYGTIDGVTTAPYNTIFKVASLTKPIFAITILKLIEKGAIGLDEPLYPYWVDPEVKADERHKKLTPRIVLSHQTGFPNWRYLTDNKKLTFQFEPGTKFQYSGEGFEYLRKAVEKKLGKNIEDLAKELLFDPLGMADTHFWWDNAMDESRYAQNFNDKGEMLPTAKYYEANAAANVLTTVQDYGTFMTHVVNGAGLSKTLFKEMWTPQVSLKENNYFGLGWEMFTGFTDDETALVHSGKDPGVSTLAVMFPKSKKGYVIFMNGDNMFKIYEHLLKERMYLGKDLWNSQ